jgi:predicted nucleotidyltransferase
MTIADLRRQNLILFEAISGSRAYGTDLPHSDTDLKGVFILPEDQFFGLEYTPQIANDTNDEVFYELRRFVELLLKNNPTLLDLLRAINHRFKLKFHKPAHTPSTSLYRFKLCKRNRSSKIR